MFRCAIVTTMLIGVAHAGPPTERAAKALSLKTIDTKDLCIIERTSFGNDEGEIDLIYASGGKVTRVESSSRREGTWQVSAKRVHAWTGKELAIKSSMTAGGAPIEIVQTYRYDERGLLVEYTSSEGGTAKLTWDVTPAGKATPAYRSSRPTDPSLFLPWQHGFTGSVAITRGPSVVNFTYSKTGGFQSDKCTYDAAGHEQSCRDTFGSIEYTWKNGALVGEKTFGRDKKPLGRSMFAYDRNHRVTREEVWSSNGDALVLMWIRIFEYRCPGQLESFQH